MAMYTSVKKSEFCLEGRFLDFVIKDGHKLKGLLLATADGECYVKLAKHLRIAFDWRLPRGTWLQVIGRKQYNTKDDQLKVKAERVIATNYSLELVENIVESPTAQKPKAEKKQTILMCQKSDCMKRGGKTLCQFLESELSDRGLQDQVNIKGTGCMKKCKAGPNLVMPDKTRYTKVKPSQVAILVDKHFGTETEIESPQFAEL